MRKSEPGLSPAAATAARPRPRLHEPTVPLHEVTMLCTEPLPSQAANWPVHTQQLASGGALPRSPYVLCGSESGVLALLEQQHAVPPLYVLTESPAAAIAGRRNVQLLCEKRSFWEVAVSTVCSLHISSIPAMVLQHACATPLATAVVDAAGELSYGQLVSLGGCVCAELSARGIRAGDVVGVLLEPSRWAIAWLLGLGLHRVTACHLSGFPAQRELQLRRISKELGGCVAVLLDTDQHCCDLPHIRVDQLALDPSQRSATAVRQLYEAHGPTAPLSDVAFVDWTSGSTGRPKGMAVTMWKIAHWVRWRSFHFPLADLGRRIAMGLFLPWYWHLPLAQGATLLLIPRELTVDVRGLVDFLRHARADWVDCFTPGQLQMVTELCDALRLTHVMCSGEALPVHVARAFLAKFPSVTLSNVLSTTETSADICMLRHVTASLCDSVAAVASHLPVLDADAGSVVWQNEVSVDERGCVVHSGWNVEAGYLPDDDSSAFQSADAVGADAAIGVCRTADRGVWHALDGRKLLCLEGRADSVVKVRGHRVDLAGVEAALAECAAVSDCCVFTRDDSIWAAVVTADLEAVEAFCQARWPMATRPAAVAVSSVWYTHTGKRDRIRMGDALQELLQDSRQYPRAARATAASADGQEPVSPHTDAQNGNASLRAGAERVPLPTEAQIAESMAAQLGRRVDPDDDFFAAGGSSFKALRICAALDIPVAEFFAHPSAAKLARFLRSRPQLQPLPILQPTSRQVVVAGMALRFPGAGSAEELWRRLLAGDDLLQELPGVKGDSSGYVRRKGVVRDEGVDLQLWGLRPAAAERMSREQRAMLQLAREALLDGGFEPHSLPGRAGVFVAGGSLPHLAADLDAMRAHAPDEYFATEVGVDKDFLASTIAFHLGLTGPAEVVQTSCSSSLVAIAHGVHALRLGLCDIVVCGGASFSPDQAVRAMDGMIWAADGFCRPFADAARGTVPADGAGVVVLTSLAPLRRPYAVVDGVAVNNDGRRKPSFSQPSHDGQVEVLRMALADARREAAEVDYVEAHATGTLIGDPIELHALADVHARRDRALAVGSIKGNLGHLNTAAGIAGFIKGCLCVSHGAAPPTIHGEPLNSKVPWSRMPLRVATDGVQGVRCVGVSAFGVGGTNAHAILSAPPIAQVEPGSVVGEPQPPAAAASITAHMPLGAGQPRRQQEERPADFTHQVVDRRGARDGLFYEVAWLPQVVAELQLPFLPVVLLDGSADFVAGLQLEPAHTLVPFGEAAVAARRHRAIALAAGGRDSLDDVAALIARTLRVLLSISQATVGEVQTFVLLGGSSRYAPLRGLLRCCRTEHPELRLRVTTVESGRAVLPALPMEAKQAAGEVFVPRIVRVDVQAAAGADKHAAGTALVTGGLRGLGLLVGRWLLDEGHALRLILVGRCARSSAELDQLRSRGALVHVCDVTNAAQLEHLPDADLVVHCAGVVDDQLARDTDEARVAAVLAPKVDGTRFLRQRFSKARFVCFSSSSAAFGVVGQASYCAANCFVDEYCGGESIQWGGWSGAGMAVDHSIARLNGERFLTPERGLQALGTLLHARRDAPTLVLDVDWHAYSSNRSVFDQTDALASGLAHPTEGGLRGGLPAPSQSDELVCTREVPVGVGIGSLQQLLQQHVVSGRAVMPASAYVSLAVEVLSARLRVGGALVLRDCRFKHMLDLSARRTVGLAIMSSADADPADDSDGHEAGEVRFTCEGRLTASMRFECLPPKLVETWHGDAARVGRAPLPSVVADPYSMLAEHGFSYGDAFARLQHVRTAADSCAALASMRNTPSRAGLRLCPGELDSALQLGSFVGAASAMGAAPTRIAEFRWLAPQPTQRVVASATSALSRSCDVTMLDAHDGLTAMALGIEMTAVQTAPALLLKAFMTQCTVPSDSTALEHARERLELPAHQDRSASKTVEALDRIRLASRERPIALRVAHASSSPLSAVAAGALEMGVPLITDAGGELCEKLLDLPDAAPEIAATDEAFRVVVDAELGLTTFQRCVRPHQLSADAVEVRTSLWALNFRDVLVAKGAIPSDVAGRALGLGGECYGVVEQVGESVRSVTVGDTVICVPPEGLGSYLLTSERWVKAAPPGMSPEDAVAATMAYATAWFALISVARIAKGETVLVHSAAGGVGLAAVHLCLRAGCVVLASASTSAKRELLHKLGAAATFNSRDPVEFSSRVQEVTDSAGVDVVLNSLAGAESIAASLQLLKPFGRFVELGKRSAFEGHGLPSAPFLRGLSYSAAHLDVLMLQQPDVARELLEEVWCELATLPRLPTTAFELAELNAALDYMARGQHIGKVLLRTSKVELAPLVSTACGPDNDPMLRSLSAISTTGIESRFVVLPHLATDADDILRDASAVFTRSCAVARRALELAVPLAVEVRCGWGQMSAQQLRQALAQRGHVVVVSEELAVGVDLEWLTQVVAEVSGDFVAPDDSFEGCGIDSLMLISLAQRVSARCGRPVGIDELQRADSIRKLADALAMQSTATAAAPLALRPRRPPSEPRRPRVICLHGFRSNSDLLRVQLAPFFGSDITAAFEFVFVNAPRPASGDSQPDIPPEVPTFEWWGEGARPYELAWQSGFVGFDDALRFIEAHEPFDGAIGFSQGAAVASLTSSRWLVLFSAVEPPSAAWSDDPRPSLHVYDPREPHVGACAAMRGRFEGAQWQPHSQGHAVPSDSDAVAAFRGFLQQRRRECGECLQGTARESASASGSGGSALGNGSVRLLPQRAAAAADARNPYIADGRKGVMSPAASLGNEPGLVVLDFEELLAPQPETLERLRSALVGDRAFGIVGVRGVPGLKSARRAAFEAAVRLATQDEGGRERAAAVRQTYPGWNGTPGRETHPLQSCFIHNIKEEVCHREVDAFYGKNVWPDDGLRRKFTAMNEAMYSTALRILSACDTVLEAELGPRPPGRLSLASLGAEGTTLAGRWIWYDSLFSRDDSLLNEPRTDATRTDLTPCDSSELGPGSEGGAVRAVHSDASATADPCGSPERLDGLASMRTHATAMRSNGGCVSSLSSNGCQDGGDAAASMRTPATAVRSSGHDVGMRDCSRGGGEGDGLASMRTHSTAIKSSGVCKGMPKANGGVDGAADDGLASMRTHATAVRSSGRGSIGSSRLYGGGEEDSNHDGTASMRAHTTAVTSSGGSASSSRIDGSSGSAVGEDGLASMRTHSTAVRSSGGGVGMAEKANGGVDGAGDDRLASMRTHATAVRSSGASASGVRANGGGRAGVGDDGLASMRTHSTATRSSGRAPGFSINTGGGCHADDDAGLASSHPKLTLPPSSGGTGDHGADRCRRTDEDGVETAQAAEVAAPSVQAAEAAASRGDADPRESQAAVADDVSLGEYWLPWHIDSQFVTLLTADDFFDETSGERRPAPADRAKAGLVAMNKAGDVAAVAPYLTEDTMLLQMGGFAQIFTGGVFNACRHAVLRQSAQLGVARATYCNFWYAPWDEMCTLPSGKTRSDGVNAGWNALMDASYVDISMQRSFSNFREFFAAVPVADETRREESESFVRLVERLPLPIGPTPLRRRAGTEARVVIDVLTDIRCPFSHVALGRLRLAIARLEAEELVALRYHPVFLDPMIAAEGEDLDSYLLREHSVTPDMSAAAEYPLNQAAKQLGFSFNPKRRVVNTARAFAAVAVAREDGLECEMFAELSRSYFEHAADICKEPALLAAAEAVGIRRPPAVETDFTVDFVARMEAAADSVSAAYAAMSDLVPRVPCMLLRTADVGDGLVLVGARSVESFVGALQTLLNPSRSAAAGVHHLLQPPGMLVRGFDGRAVRLSHANPRHPVSLHMIARRGWFPPAWPYTAADFRRVDESDDALKYATPRMVTHLDTMALASLTRAYDLLLSAVPHLSPSLRSGPAAKPLSILDTCSSWTSHLPSCVPSSARLVVQGLNESELRANAQATEFLVQDLNRDASLPYADHEFDFVTSVSSVDYLTQPREVFSEIHRVLRPGGCVAVAFSNRCFDDKAVALWLRKISDGAALAQIVCDYLHYAVPSGWSHISSVDLSPRDHADVCLGDPLHMVIAVK